MTSTMTYDEVLFLEFINSDARIQDFAFSFGKLRRVWK
jgi:hypothetical protein